MPPERASQILIGSMRDESALHFFAHSAGDHDHDREDDRIGAGPQHVLERVRGDVVEAGREAQDERPARA